MGQAAQKGYTLVPLKVYLKDSLVKVEVSLARGKKLYDKERILPRRIKGERQNGILKSKISIDYSGHIGYTNNLEFVCAHLYTLKGCTGFDGGCGSSGSHPQTPGLRKKLELKYKSRQ